MKVFSHFYDELWHEAVLAGLRAGKSADVAVEAADSVCVEREKRVRQRGVAKARRVKLKGISG